MPTPVSDEQRQQLQAMLARARAAMQAIEGYDEARINRLCQAMAWATANEPHMTRIANMAVDETALGDRVGRVSKRIKIIGVLRDCLRQKGQGIIEEIPEKGIVKYAKPAGRDRLAHSHHQSRADAAGDRPLRAQVQGRGDLLAAPARQESHQRSGPRDARGAAAPGRARGPVPGHRAAVHPADPGTDGDSAT